MELTKAFETYRNKTYPESDLYDYQSHGGKHFLRFELGDKLPNNTQERVKQACYRAYTLFQEIFKDKNEPLWILAYEFIDDTEIWKTYNPYFHTLIPSNKDQHIGRTTSPYSTSNIKVTITQLSQNDFDISPIIMGIANLEMGFEPAISQRIYFFSPSMQTIFYMYDDRGCLIWAEDRAVLKPILDKYDDWIVEYHRKAIEKQFL